MFAALLDVAYLPRWRGTGNAVVCGWHAIRKQHANPHNAHENYT